MRSVGCISKAAMARDKTDTASGHNGTDHGSIVSHHVFCVLKKPYTWATFIFDLVFNTTYYTLTMFSGIFMSWCCFEVVSLPIGTKRH